MHHERVMPPYITDGSFPQTDLFDYHEDGNFMGHDSGLVKANIFQQSVTLTAKMWPQDNSTSVGGSSWRWTTWRVPTDQLPLVIAVFCGGALILLLVVAAILWRFCVAPHRNKDYRVKMADNTTIQPRPVVPVLPSESAVYLDPKSGQWSVSSRLLDHHASDSRHWFYNSHILNPATLERCVVPRSVSVPTTHNTTNEVKRPPRPHSQPSSLSPVPKRLEGPCSLPQISEFSPHMNLSASSSILEESGSREVYLSPFGGTMMKTQSLPACVRNKARPLSTADDLSELYAKVNFSKKRKNRMRNDEAAIIALSKSRSQFLHKDTDSLVDNEAVVVYDERTAL
uniref:Putative conserved plasma membrane protein n=1 Tax=Panstrongylus megistus TaxID=65343 RepID=A0A069DYP1_9HEMI